MKYLSLFLFLFLLFNIPAFAQTQLQSYSYNAKQFANEQKYAEAIEEITKAIVIQPNEISLYLIRADYYKKLKNTQAFQADVDMAISIINKSIEEEPKNAELYLKRAGIYNYAKNKQAVREDVNTALSISPNDIKILRGSRSQLSSIADYEESLKIADKIIFLNSSEPDDFYSRAVIKRKLEDFRGAMEDYIKGLEITDMYKTIYELKYIYRFLDEELSNYENVLSYYERILVILDKRATFPYNTIRQLSNNPQLNEQINRASNKNNRETAFRNIMQILKICIELYQKKGMLDRADELIEQITKYEPKDLSLQFRNEMQLKIKAIRDEVQINQKVARLIARGDLLLAQKQYEKAIDVYQEAIKLNNSKEANQKLFQALQMKVEIESK